MTKVYAVFLSFSNAESENIIVNVSAKYKNLKNVFEKAENLTLLNHNSYDYVIDLKSEKTSSFNSLYNLSATELSTFREYLK